MRNTNTDNNTTGTTSAEDFESLLALFKNNNEESAEGTSTSTAEGSDESPIDISPIDTSSFYEDADFYGYEDDYPEEDDYDSSCSSSSCDTPSSTGENINGILNAIKYQPVSEVKESDFASRIYYGMKVADVIDSFFRGCNYKYFTDSNQASGFLFISQHMVDDSRVEVIVNVNYGKKAVQTTIKLTDVNVDPTRKALLLSAINKVNTSNYYGNVFVSPENDCFLFHSFSIAHGFSLAAFEDLWFNLIENSAKITLELSKVCSDKLSRAESIAAVKTINGLASNINYKCKNKKLSDEIKALIDHKLSPAEEALLSILVDNLK